MGSRKLYAIKGSKDRRSMKRKVSDNSSASNDEKRVIVKKIDLIHSRITQMFEVNNHLPLLGFLSTAYWLRHCPCTNIFHPGHAVTSHLQFIKSHFMIISVCDTILPYSYCLLLLCQLPPSWKLPTRWIFWVICEEKGTVGSMLQEGGTSE